ncbi:MAG: alpha/beta hydrolase-fold protein [Acidimicrobiia bacterium]|nr:alpha/beta hydrolase-fold protein [Acidimicrobiia bacterium]MDH4306540.1 alpha/beta hydrolase-fold protein [Acidimicrobiia bacterium]
MKAETWFSERLGSDLTLMRWGELGTPVLLFPTAGGDAGEADRMGLVGALAPLLADGRVKVYSVDSVAGRSWLERRNPLHSAWLQQQFDAAIRWEVVPAIRSDCNSDGIEIIAAGASFGAFNAVEVLCRHPDAFRAAVGMSGTYDLSPWLEGGWSDTFYFSSPLHYLPDLGPGEQLDRLRSRFVLLATGTGAHENPGESWWLGDVLGAKGIPNRVDNWPGWEHDWPTWRAMLPVYLDELV